MTRVVTIFKTYLLAVDAERGIWRNFIILMNQDSRHNLFKLFIYVTLNSGQTFLRYHKKYTT